MCTEGTDGKNGHVKAFVEDSTLNARYFPNFIDSRQFPSHCIV